MAQGPPRQPPTDDFDPSTDVPPEKYSFSPEALERFRAILGVSAKKLAEDMLPELEEIAVDYRRSVYQTLSAPRRAKINKELKSLGEDARAFAQRLRNLDNDVLFEVISRFELATEDESETDTRRKALASELDDLGRAMRRAHKLRKTQTGPEKNYNLALAVTQLAEVYERVTGEPVQHNTSRKMEYQRTPQTPAGKFMLEFFTQVDPRKANKEWATDSAVSTVLANHIRRRNAEPGDREDPPSGTT